MLRIDLAPITESAVDAGLYTQLVTSGVGLTAERLDAVVDAGLHSVQLSVQHADPRLSDKIADHPALRSQAPGCCPHQGTRPAPRHQRRSAPAQSRLPRRPDRSRPDTRPNTVRSP
ncbi:radical SAM protein [Streptomyces sp. NPDC021056]|uniref:radical SAM protein n=1 Tax=Streptomyces sp. NPDC021056 TaxID=3155012 RepID=UPI0033F959C0